MCSAETKQRVSGFDENFCDRMLIGNYSISEYFATVLCAGFNVGSKISPDIERLRRGSRVGTHGRVDGGCGRAMEGTVPRNRGG